MYHLSEQRVTQIHVVYVELWFSFSEKDTMDVWCNGQNIETAVSYFQ